MLLAKAAQLTRADGHIAHRRQPRAQLTVLASGSSIEPQTAANRRSCLAAALAVALASGTAAAPPQAAEAAAAPSAAPAAGQRLTYFADTFTTTTTGLRYLDVKVGEGTAPEPGDTCVVNWAGYTKGYQGKRFGNSSIEDREPFEFVLGSQQAIPAVEEAVAGMRAGGLRRIEIPGSIPELGYPLARNVRFTNEVSLYSDKIYKYRFGPQPQDFFGQRALDFVLDNPTLQDFNRDLLIDIKLLAVRKSKP